MQKTGVRFVAADMLEANEMVVGIIAVVAQAERKMISAGRTRHWRLLRRAASNLAASVIAWTAQSSSATTKPLRGAAFQAFGAPRIRPTGNINQRIGF